MTKTWLSKSVKTAALIALVVGVPVLIHPPLGQLPAVWFLALMGCVLNMSQPDMGDGDNAKDRSDGGSMLFLLVAGCGVFLVPLIHMIFRAPHFPDFSLWISWVGAAMMVFGMAFRIYSIRVLGKFFTSKVEIQQDHEIVRTGPYRFLRHPSYTGAWFFALGVGVLFQSTWSVAFVLVAFTGAYFYRIQMEEQALEACFGDAYRVYKSETWRMIPGIF